MRGKILYSCSECGAQFPKWSGQCGECREWNTLMEVAVTGAKSGQGYQGYAGNTGASKIQQLHEIEPDAHNRVSTGLAELDRVLGGGLVSGSVVLIGGDPGIGKSTLLLQAAASLKTRSEVLYVTGEESLEQIGMRARRLALSDATIGLLSETRVEAIIEHAARTKPGVMVIDSIQTVYTERVQSAPGAVGQLRESTAQLVRFAKDSGTALFLVGHVTKEGQLAGPRVLEHMVDAVLYFEGDPDSRYRLIRAIKNRFGAVNEIGVFAMTDKGLREVANPSAIFLSRHDIPVSGSLITVTREGSRPMLVEVQALVASAQSGNPRRLTLGLEQNRLAMLLAVLNRHGGMPMHDQDVFVNLVGGVRVTETAADLPVLLAILSSYRDKAVASDLVAFGEVGLAGEIRPVQNGQDRLREASKHGFKRAIVPKANTPKSDVPVGLELIPVQSIAEALEHL